MVLIFLLISLWLPGVVFADTGDPPLPSSWVTRITDSIEGIFSGRMFKDMLTDTVSEVVSETAVQASTKWVSLALLPSPDLLMLEGLATDRLPPGQVQAFRRLWAQSWWASLAGVVLATIIQAIRAAGTLGDGESGSRQWGVWLAYPMIAALIGRVSLFLVDTLVVLQNQIWHAVLKQGQPCTILFGYCGTASTTVPGTQGLAVWVLAMVPVLLLSFVLAINWVMIAILTVFAPIWLTFVGGSARSPEPMLGWLWLMIRSVAVQSMVGGGLFFLTVLQDATQEPGAVGKFLLMLERQGLLRFSVSFTLLLLVTYKWLLPTLRAGTDLVTLQGGQAVEATEGFGRTVGAVLTGAGVLMGQPALVSAGARTTTAAAAFRSRAADFRLQTAERLHISEARRGGWITRAPRSSRQSAENVKTEQEPEQEG